MHENLPKVAPQGSERQAGNRVTVRSIGPESIDAQLIAAWQHLGERALAPNAYLTPMFVLPALAHMGSTGPVEILLIEGASGELIGIGVFDTRPLLPLTRLQSLVGFRSKHSYLTGLLVDGEQAVAAVDAFFEFVSRPGTCWHGVRFDWLSAECPFGALLIERARRRNIWWSESERMRRAVLLPKHNDGATLVERIPPRRLKELRRCARRLSDNGRLDWHIHHGENVHDAVIERFLSLEHMGWKGESGSSVRANPEHEQFFTAMIAGFRANGGLFFTELLHDGKVIASSCNLISGNSAFAFKIGWDPDYARYSPGMLNELYLLEQAGELFGHLDLIDSGALEGSFIDRLWFDKRDILSGVFATTRLGKLLFGLAAARRRIRQLGARLSWASQATN